MKTRILYIAVLCILICAFGNTANAADAPFQIINIVQPSYVLPGQSTTITFSVQNTGSVGVDLHVDDIITEYHNDATAVHTTETKQATYTGGDANTDGKLSGGEIWSYTVTYTKDFPIFNLYVDPVRPLAIKNEIHAYAWTSGGHVCDSEYVYYFPFMLTKDVVGYGGADVVDNTVFNVDIYRNSVYLTTLPISETTPIKAWFTTGMIEFKEQTRSGYVPVDTIVYQTCSRYPTSKLINSKWVGCTPGFWKNHPTCWAATGYSPNQPVTEVFSNLPASYNDVTMMEALSLSGGSDLDGGRNILLRAAVAGVLNEAKFGNAYPPYASTNALISAVNNALVIDHTNPKIDRAEMISLASTIDGWNNGYHPDPWA